MGQEEVSYRRVSAQDIRTYSEQIGHILDEDADIDQLNTGGWPGIADTTHAEKQAALVWKAAFPDNNGVECMLRLAKDVFAEQVSALDANQQMGDFWTQADNCRSQLRRRIGNSSPACAGHAAAVAVAVALADKKVADCASGEDDETRNYYDWDVSYFASIAYANGGLSNPKANIEERREFWKWYLQEAVPAAYVFVADAP